MSSSGMSGFPEWLPEQQLVEEHFLEIIRHQFELHGFAPLRTRSVERMDDLVTQGETSKEIFAIRRVGAPPDAAAEAELGLHYDLTVPFARFVSENRGRLAFPFRRYQIQPAWRGERPQLGRYREFLQADADVIVQGDLDIRYDAEMVALLNTTIKKLPVPPVRLLVNNRKLLEGYYRTLGIADVTGTLRTVDKLGKIGPRKTIALLEQLGLDSAQAAACVQLAEVEAERVPDLQAVRPPGDLHPLFEQGLSELATVLEASQEQRGRSRVVAALHVARGFDYYTGTVVEGVFAEHRELGAICSGGRYDNLATGEGDTQKLPGVGISIGVTRMLAYAFHLGLLKQSRKNPASVLVAVHSADQRRLSDAVAAALRQRGIPCLVSDTAAAYGKQLRVADRLGIPYVWFPAFDGKPHEVKDVASGEQSAVDLEGWSPAADKVALRFE